MTQTLVAPETDAPREAEIAFEELYRSSRDDVYAYVAGVLRDRSAAEEVTAIAFERAFRKRARFNPAKGSPRAWLFGIARNAALDELRRKGRGAPMRAEHDSGEAIFGTAPASDEAILEEAERGWRRGVIREALTLLSARERELIALKFFSGLDNAAIAETLGISESNAGTRLHRAITKLRKACNETA